MKNNLLKTIELGCNYFGITYDELIIKTKKVELLEKRQAIQYACYEFNNTNGMKFNSSLSKNISVQEIAINTGVKKHSTIYNSVKQIKNIIDMYPNDKITIDNLMSYIEFNIYKENNEDVLVIKKDHIEIYKTFDGFFKIIDLKLKSTSYIDYKTILLLKYEIHSI